MAAEEAVVVEVAVAEVVAGKKEEAAPPHWDAASLFLR